MTYAQKVVIGDATLYQADCLEVLPTLEKVDCVITDPPYEIQQKAGTSTMYGTRVMEFAFDTPGVTDGVVIPAMKQAFALSQSFHVFCDPEQFKGIADAAREFGMTPKPWAKQKLCAPPPMPGNWWPSGFELACFGYKPGAYFGDDSGTRKNIMVFDAYRHGIRASEKVAHPTQKWLPMIAYLVKTLVPPGGACLDPFMGSGTTGVAAIQLGRKFIGIERDAVFFAMARERIEQAHAQGQLFEPERAKQEQMSLEVGA